MRTRLHFPRVLACLAALGGASCHGTPRSTPAPPSSIEVPNATVPNATPSSEPRSLSGGDSCRSVDDCATTIRDSSCCEVCLARALTRLEADRLVERCEGGVVDRKCPKLDCPIDRNAVDCVQGGCVMRVASSLRMSEIADRAAIARATNGAASLDVAIPDSAYKPHAGSTFNVAFQDNGTRVVILAGNDPLSGKVKPGSAPGTTIVDLERGHIVRGRLTIVTQPDGTRRGTFTVLGPGGRLEGSERGALITN